MEGTPGSPAAPPAQLAALTPAGRDRFVDLLRVVALAGVMLGHFTMAAVVPDGAGGATFANTLSVLTWAQPLTWVFQVMPVFFVVGGFAHARTLASLQRRDGSYADFVACRTRRLVRPTLVFVLAGLATGAATELLHVQGPVVDDVLRLVGQPLWFVGIYLAVLTFAPPMHGLDARWGARVVVVLVALVAAVDVLRLGFGVPGVGTLNFVLVWLAAHQLGFGWARGAWTSRRAGVALATGGLLSAVLLVTAGPYPVSMVGLPGQDVSNLSPPSLALLALAVGQVGLLVLARPAATRWLATPRVWVAVVVANGVALTAFLWHLSAVVAVNAAWVASALPLPEVGSAAWWWSRMPLLLGAAVVLAALVLALRRFEQVPAPMVPHVRRAHRDGWALVGLVLTTVGVLGFAVTGFAGVTSFQTRPLVVVPMTPAANLALLAAGTWLVHRAVSAAGRAGAGTPPAGSPRCSRGRQPLPSARTDAPRTRSSRP